VKRKRRKEKERRRGDTTWVIFVRRVVEWLYVRGVGKQALAWSEKDVYDESYQTKHLEAEELWGHAAFRCASHRCRFDDPPDPHTLYVHMNTSPCDAHARSTRVSWSNIARTPQARAHNVTRNTTGVKGTILLLSFHLSLLDNPGRDDDVRQRIGICPLLQHLSRQGSAARRRRGGYAQVQRGAVMKQKSDIKLEAAPRNVTKTSNTRTFT